MNDVYTDYEGEPDNVTDNSDLVHYWHREVDRREYAVSQTIRHFMGKSDVSLDVFAKHLETIYNFLETGKTKV